MIGRERARNLNKTLIRLYSRIKELDAAKVRTQILIEDLPPEKIDRLPRLQYRIYRIDNEILEIQNFISTINDQILNLNYKIKDTIGLPNDRENDHIFKNYYYNDISKTTFAPYYPIRISS